LDEQNITENDSDLFSRLRSGSGSLHPWDAVFQLFGKIRLGGPFEDRKDGNIAEGCHQALSKPAADLDFLRNSGQLNDYRADPNCNGSNRH
jgi:hypothetical protein